MRPSSWTPWILVLLVGCLAGPGPAASPITPTGSDGESPEPATGSVDETSFGKLLEEARSQAQNGNWAESARLWGQVVEQNPINDGFWDTLAYSRFRSGRFHDSVAAYKKVFELRGEADPYSAYAIACAHARQGHSDLALDWLEQSLKVGLPEFQIALDDEDLASVREHARFRKLMALVDRDAVTREAGWAHDLRLIQREVKRIGYDPFRLMTEEQFDQRIDELISRVGELDDPGMKVECMKLMRRIGDGHTSFYGRFETVPVRFYLFEEGLFIVAADPSHRELLGTQVLRFDDRTVEEIMAGVAQVQSRDNDHWLKEIGPHKMRSPGLLHALGLTRKPDRYELSLRFSTGTTRSVVLEQQSGLGRIWNGIPDSWITFNGAPEQALPLYRQRQTDHFRFEAIADRNVIYAQINRMRDSSGETFAAFCRRLFSAIDQAGAVTLIIDIRLNKGGNTSLAVPLLDGIAQRPFLNQRGRLFVVAGRRTFSAAQNLATIIETRTNAIFAGEPTGSSPNFVGEENNFRLPYSGVEMSISNVRWVYASPFDRRSWIAPEIYAPPSFAAYAANVDPVLRAILQFIDTTQGL